MFDAKKCNFLPQETLFTAVLSQMLWESQHTPFEDQILGQVSLWGRPASCASLHHIKSHCCVMWMLINLYLRLFSLFGQASVLLKQLLDFLQKSLTLLLNMLSFVSGYFFIPSNSSADGWQSRLIFDINRNLMLSHDPPLLLLPLLSEKITIFVCTAWGANLT